MCNRTVRCAAKTKRLTSLPRTANKATISLSNNCRQRNKDQRNKGTEEEVIRNSSFGEIRYMEFVNNKVIL